MGTTKQITAIKTKNVKYESAIPALARSNFCIGGHQMTEETIKNELAEILEDHKCNLEHIDLIDEKSFKYMYELLVKELLELVE